MYICNLNGSEVTNMINEFSAKNNISKYECVVCYCGADSPVVPASQQFVACQSIN